MHVIFPTCTNTAEQARIWSRAREYGDDLNRGQLMLMCWDPRWSLTMTLTETTRKCQDRQRWAHVLTCLIQGMKRATTKAVTMTKVKKLLQAQIKTLLFSCLIFQRLYAFSPTQT